ncbi:MAG: hypothetical protein ACM3WV_01130 [Bacillota bacterium]
MSESRTNREFAHTVVTKCLQIAVCTKNFNWNDDEFLQGVSKPYGEILQMQMDLERTGKKPAVEQMKRALDMLRSVFLTKKTPAAEQTERFREVLTETGTEHLFSDCEWLGDIIR